MRLSIRGVNLPGRVFCRPDGSLMENVHVGVQLGREPAELVRADAGSATWDVDIDVVHAADGLDFRGRAVQGKRGERFVYLTWNDVGPDGKLEMFRRAKLVLGRVPADVMDSAVRTGRLVAAVNLTDAKGGPRCARLDPPDLVWSAGPP